MINLGVVQAVNELRGDVSNSPYYIKECSNIIAVVHGKHIALEKRHPDAKYICTIEEFERCALEMAEAAWLNKDYPGEPKSYGAYKLAWRDMLIADEFEAHKMNEEFVSDSEYEKGMRESMRKISRLVGKSFGVNIGYETLPDAVDKAINGDGQWKNGDVCVHPEINDETIYLCIAPINNGSIIYNKKTDTPHLVSTVLLSKPETEAQKKEREAKAKSWASAMINQNTCELAYYLVDAGVKLPEVE